MPYREFILQFNKQASKCNYDDRLEEQLCDRLVAGINNSSLKRKILKKNDITITEAQKIGVDSGGPVSNELRLRHY
ncbi:unnamed protein product [Echinostoma caproni]|uniref:Uncharacterized protein n=1 Tax=Echinostoma caproni TaxID=27848 RepID=A0A183BF05_9TREM|nr:unnamed protein product [Echinostoma caproni]